METLTGKEFFEQLNSNSLKQPLVIKGIVKKSEKDSEVLFKRVGGSSGWVSIPSSMVESVKIIKTFSREEASIAFVKLLLKEATTPEGEVLTELLSSDEQSNCDGNSMHKQEACGIHEGSENVCTHCGCHKDEHQCKCGHQAEYHNSSCGFHGTKHV